jgi:hypothetical protein
MRNMAAFRNVTPNAKIALVNNKLGNPALKNNQGSSTEVYDYINVTATIGTQQVLRFFESANTRTFPFTNLTAGGNALQAGEALSIQYAAFTRIEVVRNSGAISKFEALTAAVSELSLSQIQVLLDNSRIIKNNTLCRSFADLNTQGGTAANSLFYPDTDLVIPPQIQFTVELQTPANSDTTTDVDVYYGCHLFGTGAILNLKANV